MLLVALSLSLSSQPSTSKVNFEFGPLRASFSAQSDPCRTKTATSPEVARTDWKELVDPIVQIHLTTTFSGRIRAWGLHQESTDRLFIVSGLVKIVIFDGRQNSPTFGHLNEFTVSEKNPGLLIIPPNLYHGWKNIGTSEAIIINMPTKMYNYEAPDALDLPWDSEAAARIVPYRW
jgi:dTDP-4-dehydrorhamnose 3,5-epimerase